MIIWICRRTSINTSQDDPDDRATGAWHNLGGLGNKVSDHVKYTPWGIADPLPGDLNHDGKVNLADAVLALQIMAGIVPASPIFLDEDVNGDGRIGMAEVIYVMRMTGKEGIVK